MDIDGNGAKDLVILDTATDHPIHIRFATEEKKLGPEQRFAVEVPRAITFGQIDGQGGVEILTIENQSGRSKVLSLDQSGTDEANKWGRLAFFGLPQGAERGRSLALGDLDGDGTERCRRHRPVQCPGLGVSPIRTMGTGLPARRSPAWSARGPSSSPIWTVTMRTRSYVLSEQEKQIGQCEFARGRLSFPTPLPIVGEPVAMDLSDLDGNKPPSSSTCPGPSRAPTPSSCAPGPR